MDIFLGYDWLVKYNPEVIGTQKLYDFQDAQETIGCNNRI